MKKNVVKILTAMLLLTGLSNPAYAQQKNVTTINNLESVGSTKQETNIALNDNKNVENNNVESQETFTWINGLRYVMFKRSNVIYIGVKRDYLEKDLREKNASETFIKIFGNQGIDRYIVLGVEDETETDVTLQIASKYGVNFVTYPKEALLTIYD